MNIIACGALSHELVALRGQFAQAEVQIRCLPAHYHATPNKIPAALERVLDEVCAQSDKEVLVAYGDCGTGGELDRVLDTARAKYPKHAIQRTPGAHCYEFFAGSEAFSALQEAELGTFYLTDFLTQHFETYVWRALGLDRKPELLPMYFEHYRKLVYLAQTERPDLDALAQQHAERLGLAYQRVMTGYGGLAAPFSVSVNPTIEQAA